MIDYSTDTSICREIGESAKQIVPRLDHSRFKQCEFKALADEAPKVGANFDKAWLGFTFAPPFLEIGILDQRAILFARDYRAMVSSAYAVEDIIIEATHFKASAERLAPDIYWPWHWEKYDPIAENFKYFASVVEQKMGEFPYGKSQEEAKLILSIEQVAFQVDSIHPTLGKMIRQALGAGNWKVLDAALTQCTLLRQGLGQ